jgi:hypothetical protein
MTKNQLQNRYIQSFGVLVILLALVRCAFPGIAEHSEPDKPLKPQIIDEPRPPHPIRSVPNYAEAFPDTNALQMTAAQRWGVAPATDRRNAEERKNELVYIGASPYYSLATLNQSIPYLVPRAAILLEDIGRAYFDSLQLKGLPLHRIIVSSVLRTQTDVANLRSFNGNAIENSCHLFGTTFDIKYIKYERVQNPDTLPLPAVRDDSLKWVLSEVLRDMRQQGRCYIKYEKRQSCFHITVR